MENKNNAGVGAWATIENLRGNEVEIEERTLVKCNVCKDVVIKGIDEVDCDIVIAPNSGAIIDIIGDVRFEGDHKIDGDTLSKVKVHSRKTLDGVMFRACGYINVEYDGEVDTALIQEAIMRLWDYEMLDDGPCGVALLGDWKLDYDDTYKVVVDALKERYDYEMSDYAFGLDTWKEEEKPFKECLIKDAGRKKLSGLNEDAIKDIIENYTVKE